MRLSSWLPSQPSCYVLSSVHAHEEKEREHSGASFYKDINPIDQGPPTFMTLSNLNYFSIGPSSKYSGVGLQHRNLEEQFSS
jgi:hypothetical protein